MVNQVYISAKKKQNNFFFDTKHKLCYGLKGTLMQISKSPYIFLFIWKQHPENFVFLTLGIVELYTRKVCKMFVYKHTETKEYVKN